MVCSSYLSARVRCHAVLWAPLHKPPSVCVNTGWPPSNSPHRLLVSTDIAAGTLREQLTYPLTPGDAAVSDTELEALLRFVGLGHLLFVGSTPADGTRTPTRASRASRFDPNDEAASLAAGNVPTVTADPAIIGHGDDVDASGVRRRRRSIYQPLLHGLLAVQAHSPSGAHSAALDAVEPWADILSVGSFACAALQVPLAH